MKRMFLILLVVVVLTGIVVIAAATRDGESITPQGEGTITLDAGAFESFPLPDYAAKKVTGAYKSYLVEVEPGSRFTYWKWDPVFHCLCNTATRLPVSCTEKWLKNYRPGRFE